MKTLSKILLALSIFSFASVAHAGSYAGEDSARHYKSAPEEFDGEYVDVDCVFVTRINGGPQVEGVTFFLAHTKDDDNRARGGSIVVAVLSDKADSFVRKYGNTLDIDRGSSEKVDSKRLRGVFHQLAQGHVYIDVSAGEAHAIILEHREDAVGAIRSGDGVPDGRLKGKGKNF
jgi:hypothetical protein